MRLFNFIPLQMQDYYSCSLKHYLLQPSIADSFNPILKIRQFFEFFGKKFRSSDPEAPVGNDYHLLEKREFFFTLNKNV